MKKIIIVLSLFLSNSLTAQLKDTILGKVKSVREELFFLDKNRQNYKLFSIDGDYGHSGFISNKATKSRFYNNWYYSSVVHYLNYFQEFNENGKPTNEIWFYKDGDTVRQYQYVYNDKNKLIQEKENYVYDESYRVTNYSYNEYRNNLQSKLFYNSDNPEEYSYVYYIYDKKDFTRIIETNSFNDEGAIGGTTFVYDNHGRKIKKIKKDFTEYHYFDDGSSSYGLGTIAFDKISEEYFYSENDSLMEIWHYGNKQKNENQVELVAKTKIFYLKNGFLEKKISTTNQDTLTSFVEYKYDSKGRKTEELNVGKRFVKKSDDILFDLKKIKLNGVKIPNDEFIVRRKLKYEYDKDNNLIELKETETFEKTVTSTCKFEYVFDENKNWIEQTKYINGEKLYVWKRKIIYY